jgi:hypothetical protein
MFRQGPVVVGRRGGMRRSRLLLLLSFVVVSSLLAWACGGGGGEKPSGPTAPAATSPAGETPEAGTTPEAQQGGSEFTGLADRFRNSTFKATYQITGEGAAGGTMIWYKKGQNMRMDMGGEVEGQQVTDILIVRPDITYYCGEIAGTGEGSTCYSTPTEAGQGVEEMVGELEKILTDPSVEIVSTTTRAIAGQDADCYTIRAPDIEGESQVCLSDEGVPLFTQETVSGQEMTMEATDFGRDVSDSDFEPPYPVSGELSGTPTGQ